MDKKGFDGESRKKRIFRESAVGVSRKLRFPMACRSRADMQNRPFVSVELSVIFTTLV